MKVSELIEKLALSVKAAGEDREIKNCYVGDLLSLAMSHLSEGSLWVTVQTNINTAAVASLTEAACILLPEDLSPDENTKNKAETEGIYILSSERTAYELCGEIRDLLS